MNHRRVRGTVKCATNDHVGREKQTLTDKARRKKHSGSFLPAFTNRFFRGIGLKPTATSNGSTPFCRVLDRGRLHSTPTSMHVTTHHGNTIHQTNNDSLQQPLYNPNGTNVPIWYHGTIGSSGVLV